MKTLLAAFALATVLTPAALAAPVAPAGTAPGGVAAPQAALTVGITTAARPGPVELTAAQMDAVTAGGSGAGADPSVFGSKGGIQPDNALTTFGTKGTAGSGGDSNIVFPTNN